MFMKRTLPMLIAFGVGFAFAVQYYIPATFSQEALSATSKWYSIIVSFALLLGIVSVCQSHARKIQTQSVGWGYSLVLFASFGVMVIVGAICAGNTEVQAGAEKTPIYGTSYGWMYNNGLLPLTTTMFATLAFYVASAAFRAFRAKTFGAFLLLFFAVVLLFGKASLGVSMWDSTIGSIHQTLQLDGIIEWIMGTLNMSARRAILIGVALGMIATSLKIIFGIERTYLGGKGE